MYICYVISNIHNLKTQKFHLIILSLVIVFISCQKETEIKPLPETGYPTTYKVLSQNEWNVRNTKFQNINTSEGLRLNKYGFVEGEFLLNDFDSITKELVVTVIDSLISVYNVFLGMPEGSGFDYERVILINAPYLTPVGRLCVQSFFEDIEQYGNNLLENVKYNFYMVQNSIHNKHISGLELSFNFMSNKNVVSIFGHWIPDAVIPQKNIYSKEDALNIAYRKVFFNTGENIFESEKDLHVYKVLQKIRKNDNIEIRDCWRIGLINSSCTGYKFSVFIDSQTGEIVKYFYRL